MVSETLPTPSIWWILSHENDDVMEGEGDGTESTEDNFEVVPGTESTETAPSSHEHQQKEVVE